MSREGAPRITESKLQELRQRHPPVGCSFRLGMYFETLSQAPSLEAHEVPDHYSSVVGTECDDTGLGSMMLYDGVKGDSASAVNLGEVEDILQNKKGGGDKREHMPSIAEERQPPPPHHHHPLERVQVRGATHSPKTFSLDSRSNGSGSGNGKETNETRSKSCTSMTSQDSGRDSNGSGKNSHEGSGARRTSNASTEKEVAAHKTGKRSKSREKPSHRHSEDHKANHLSQRVVVGAEEQTLVELHDPTQGVKIIGKQTSMGSISDRVNQKYPHVLRSETPLVAPRSQTHMYGPHHQPSAVYNPPPPLYHPRSVRSHERLLPHSKALMYTPTPTTTKQKRSHSTPQTSTQSHTHLGYF